MPEKVSRLAINMEGGFQTDKNVSWDEELKLVVLPDMETLEITNPDLPIGVQLAVAGIRTAVSAQKHAQQDGQNVAALAQAIQSAERVAQTPVEEASYALAMRELRQAIKSLNVPQASLPVMNQFKTKKW